MLPEAGKSGGGWRKKARVEDRPKKAEEAEEKKVKVQVQSLDSQTFEVRLSEEANSVADLKVEVTKAVGTPARLQQMYIVTEGTCAPKGGAGAGMARGSSEGEAGVAGGPSEEGEALKDGRKLVEDCTVVLMKAVETAWERRKGDCAERKKNLVPVCCDSDGVCDKGECVNGSGRVRWSSGAYYEGQFRNKHFEGSGAYISRTGGRYEGQWYRGMRHGFGVEDFAGGAQYGGQFDKNSFHGQGTYTFGIGEFHGSSFHSGNRHVDNSWLWVRPGDKYQGEFRDGSVRTGVAKVTHASTGKVEWAYSDANGVFYGFFPDRAGATAACLLKF